MHVHVSVFRYKLADADLHDKHLADALFCVNNVA